MLIQMSTHMRGRNTGLALLMIITHDLCRKDAKIVIT